MTIRDLRGVVEDLIPVNNVLVSVFDKSGLEEFIPNLVEINPNVRFLSTGGTYDTIRGILDNPEEERLLSIEKYTGSPEMEGGLVKTLHPKIYAGILGERNNPEHQEFLRETGGVYIDIVVVNLYPFEKVISSPETTFEHARGNIDIGGPAMLRAAAKNFPGCAAVCDPADYKAILQEIRHNNGSTSFNQRLALAKKVFEQTWKYDNNIANYFSVEGNPEKVRSRYNFNKSD